MVYLPDRIGFGRRIVHWRKFVPVSLGIPSAYQILAPHFYFYFDPNHRRRFRYLSTRRKLPCLKWLVFGCKHYVIFIFFRGANTFHLEKVRTLVNRKWNLSITNKLHIKDMRYSSVFICIFIELGRDLHTAAVLGAARVSMSVFDKSKFVGSFLNMQKCFVRKCLPLFLPWR